MPTNIRQQSDPRRPTRQRVLALKLAGTSPDEIAAALGITSQRVYQHLKALREAGLLPSEETVA